MRWLCVVAIALACFGCGNSSAPGTDAWLVGKWSLESQDVDDILSVEFWSNHGARVYERIDPDDGAWQLQGDLLVMLHIPDSNESTPDLERVNEALKEYASDPSVAKGEELWKLSDLKRDSFTISVDTGRRTLVIKAKRVKDS